MVIGELLFVIALVIGFLILPIIFKQWRLFFVFLAFFVCFGLMEWLSVTQTGLSISQHFWVFDTANPIGGWLMIIGMALAWLALLLHFKIHQKKE
jgi:uncharacterized membrane protein